MIRVDHPPHDVAAEQDAEPDNGQLRGEAGGERAEGPGRIAPLHGGLEIGGRSDRKLSLRRDDEPYGGRARRDETNGDR